MGFSFFKHIYRIKMFYIYIYIFNVFIDIFYVVLLIYYLLVIKKSIKTKQK